MATKLVPYLVATIFGAAIALSLVVVGVLPIGTVSADSDLACVDRNGDGVINKDEAIAVLTAFIFQTPISQPEPMPTPSGTPEPTPVLTATPTPTVTPTPTSTPTPTPTPLPTVDAQLSIIPSTGLVPNQTVALVGRGFSTGGAAEINVEGSVATIDGDDTDLGPRSLKFNEGDVIEVDHAGNWFSTFVIPVTGVTTIAGDHDLSITDTGGRGDSATLNMAEPTLTLTPASGEVGTRVDVTGTGFPADSPGEGGDRTVTVEIQYSVTGDTRTVVTLTPDGSGNIRGWFTVPLNAGIPSTNAVRAVFDIPGSNVSVTTSAVHQVIMPPPPNFAGTGDDVVNFELTPGDKTWAVTHNGASNFYIYLHDDEGNRDLLVNEIGEYNGTILVPVGDGLFDNSPGPATLEIRADGPWTIREQ